MPLLRYFCFVGGSLLAVLFVVNAAYPTAPLPDTLTSAADLSPIRIHSDRKWPERVVFDTSVSVPAQAPAAPVVVAQAKPPVEPPQPQAAAVPAQASLAPAVAVMSAKARVREAFAQLPQEQDAFEPKMSDMAAVVVPEPKLYPSRQPVKHKVVARPRNPHPMMMVAQQPPTMTVAQQPRMGGLFTW
jgi:hypothetical protein